MFAPCNVYELSATSGSRGLVKQKSPLEDEEVNVNSCAAHRASLGSVAGGTCAL